MICSQNSHSIEANLENSFPFKRWRTIFLFSLTYRMAIELNG